MKESTSTPTPEGASPNKFERGKPGTAGRDLAEAAIEKLRQEGGVFVKAVGATRMAMAVTEPNLPGNPIVFANKSFLKLSGYRMEEVLGQEPHFMNGPDTDPNDAARFAEALLADHDDVIETVQYRKNGTRFVATVLISAFKDDQGRTLNHFMSWLDVTRRADAENELAALQTTQSALRESEDRQAFLLELSDALHTADTADEIEKAAVQLLGRKLGASRVFYATVDEGGETWSMKHDFSESGPGGAGRFPMSEYQRRRMADWQAGKISHVADSETDPYLTEEDRAAYAAFGARAAIGIPLVKGGRFAALMVINQSTPREWKDAEIALAKEAAERTWTEIERARAEASLRENEERHAVLLRLGDALRPLTNAAEIQRTTTRMLGEHLRVDRVMFAEVGGDRGAETGTVRGQFTSPSAKPFAEHFTFDQFGAHTMPARYRGESLVVADVSTDPAFSDEERRAWLGNGVCAAVVAALAKGGKLVAEFGVHSITPRIWTDAEVSLIEEFAERTWDAAERARAEGALRESEGRYRSLFESMDEAYAVVDVLKNEAGEWTDFRFVEVNPAFLEHTSMPPPVGKTATELLGTPNPRWANLYGQALDTGKPLRVEEPEPTLGLTFELNIFTLDHEKNRVAVLFTNITGRKQAEAALRESERHANILLAELQHRVRNTLGVVRSIARRTGENSSSVEEMQAHFQGRLDAFSRVQAAMARSAAGTVDLASLIEDEMVAHAAREGEQVSIEGPAIELEPKAAERLSLAIHELTTNAVKHGAFVNATGKVRISWSREQGEGGPMLQLSWSESGVTIDPSETRRKGFGMELLQRSLPYDLQASTSVEFRPSGLHFRFSMPLNPGRKERLTAKSARIDPVQG